MDPTAASHSRSAKLYLLSFHRDFFSRSSDFFFHDGGSFFSSDFSSAGTFFSTTVGFFPPRPSCICEESMLVCGSNDSPLGELFASVLSTAISNFSKFLLSPLPVLRESNALTYLTTFSFVRSGKSTPFFVRERKTHDRWILTRRFAEHPRPYLQGHPRPYLQGHSKSFSTPDPRPQPYAHPFPHPRPHP